MSHKNGESLGTFNKWVKNTGLVFSTSLLALTGMVSNTATAAGYDCNSCNTVDCCELPAYAVYADFLYWQVTQDGLEFAQTGVATVTTASSQVTTAGKVHQPKCHWEPGFRIGLVVDLGCCDWDFFAQYTWLQNKESTKVADSATLSPLWSTNVLNATHAGGIKIAVDDQFNVLDFGLGRSFRCNECFVFRPHFGFKATWQQLKNDVYQLPAASSGGTRAHIQNKIEFDGIGLRGGFDGAWRFSPCFSIVGHAALSAVYSDISVTREDRSEIVNAAGTVSSHVTTAKVKQNICAIVPVLELMLGIRWDSRMCDCYDVFVMLGWENQVWFDTSRYIHTAADSQGSRGNTNWQGLVVRLGMGF